MLFPVSITPPDFEPVSVDDLKAHTRVDGTADDGLLGTYLRAAREKVEKESGYRLGRQTVEARGLATGRATLFVAPVQSVDVDDVAGEPIADISYRSDVGGTHISLPSAARREITIVAEVGYPTAEDVPDTFRWAIMALASWMYNNRNDAVPEALVRSLIGQRCLIGGV